MKTLADGGDGLFGHDVFKGVCASDQFKVGFSFEQEGFNHFAVVGQNSFKAGLGGFIQGRRKEIETGPQSNNKRDHGKKSHIKKNCSFQPLSVLL